MPVTNYIWDIENDSYVMETDETDTTTAVYTNEPAQFGRLISQRRSSQTSYHHFDGLGSTRELTDTSQTVTDTNMCDAWGVNVASSGTTENPFRWVGQVGYHYDEMSDTYYIRARGYDPPSGRWVSRDPLETVLALLLVSAHVYVFVDNGPPINTDPSGLYTMRREKHVTLEGTFDEWYKREKKDAGWWSALSKCPCTIKFDCGGNPVSPDGSVWLTPKEKRDFPKGGYALPRLTPSVFTDPPDLHPGAVWDMRQKDRNGKHGNQCTYDAKGRVITGGMGAGTADKRYYGKVDAHEWDILKIVQGAKKTSDRWQHMQHDIVPFWAAWLLDGKKYGPHVKKYLEVRPSLVKEGCDQNIVPSTTSGEDELKKS